MSELSLANIQTAIKQIEESKPTERIVSSVPRWWYEKAEAFIQKKIDESPHIFISDSISIEE